LFKKKVWGNIFSSIAASPHHSITPHHHITASLHRCITASQHHCIRIKASQHHSITALQHRSIAASQHHCITAVSLPILLTFSLLRFHDEVKGLVKRHDGLGQAN
jgi:hypothetical protein